MDYSLLIGIDDHARSMVVGIVDFMRYFSGDKRLESLIKGIINPSPTVLPPRDYARRFLSSMNIFFCGAPTRLSEWNAVDEAAATV
jgi:1-phosphatidylinositol-3-phosphate 5-kinase